MDRSSELPFDVDALDAFLRARLPNYGGPLRVQRFVGGQSNPTYRLETPTARYVLRKRPPDPLPPSAHAVDREYRVISALRHSGVSVPRTHVYCDDPAVIGTSFFIILKTAVHCGTEW